MLQILPFMEQNALYDQWDFTKSVSGNQAAAATDIRVFYCPTRRSGIRVKDKRIMFPDWAHDNTSYDGWTQGGTTMPAASARRTLLPTPRRQIATTGCSAGRHTSMTSPRREQARTEPNSSLCGIFVPNLATKFNDITDGLSNTIAIGEVSRTQTSDSVPGHAGDVWWGPCHTSIDGWAIAGSNTLFETTSQGSTNDAGQLGGFNTDYHESAGSDHTGGAHFGMADGSVHFINATIDPIIYAHLGSIADGQVAQVP